nr:hypothetical protein [Tanacetum cinerariifolium]
MSSDSHATITYTLMPSYEVIVNGYFGMPMDPLDPYVQLVMEAPPSPDYIPGPEAPSSPDYILGPGAPPSPDYIPGLEYPEYLPPADDVLLAKEKPLPVAVSPIAESPGYITDSEPEMELEEEDGDDEKQRGERGGVPSSDCSLHSFIPASEDSDKTEPFEEGETAATPPPFGYRVVARISVRPHIPMPFHSELEVERLLAIPTPSLSQASMVLMRSVAPSTFILALRLRTPPIGTLPLLPIPLPTSSFPLPLLLPSTSGSESTPKAGMPLQKRACFTTTTGGYEVGESSVAATARQIRPTLTVADSRRAKDRLIGKLRRER